MEIKSTIHSGSRLVHFRVWLIVVCLLFCKIADAQTSICTIKNGHMVVILDKSISDRGLDSFIYKYGLADLDLKNFLKTGNKDSLIRLGWKIEMNNQVGFLISKPLLSNNKINMGSPENKILLTQKESFAERFPITSSRVKYGYNRFKNKFPFAMKDSFVTFYLRGNTNARRVILSGSFNDWNEQKQLMTKTDSGWIAIIKLSPGKYWYKFIIDGGWTTDRDNQTVENDGLGNDNSVYFKPNNLFTLNGYTNAKKVFISGSFNNWKPSELQMTRTANGWQLPLYLADGTHTYRYLVDDNWMEDPANKEHYPNEFGEFNSVIRLGKPYVFHLDGYTDASKVMLTGSFNGWRRDELSMTKTSKGWQLPYSLGPGNYEYLYVVDGKDVRPAKLNVTNGGGENLYFVIEPNYVFRLKGYPRAKKVFLAGDFNNWSPNTFAMHREGDEWVFNANLTPGKHLYKFVVDGRWIIDPGNKLWEQNEHDTGNSVLWVDKKEGNW